MYKRHKSKVLSAKEYTSTLAKIAGLNMIVLTVHKDVMEKVRSSTSLSDNDRTKQYALGKNIDVFTVYEDAIENMRSSTSLCDNDGTKQYALGKNIDRIHSI